MGTFVVKLIQRTQLSHSQKDVKPFIYARSCWLDDEAEFDFLSTINSQNYRGVLKYEEIKNAAIDLEQPYNEFFDECKKALTTNMGLQGFDYEIDEENENQLSFKMFKCEGFETLYLDINLRKVSNCFQLLDSAIEISQQQVHEAPASQSSDTQKKGPGYLEYEQYVKDSKAKELEMMNKFLVLLNSKKAYIRDLESQLEKSTKNEEKSSDDDEEEVYGAATQAMDLDTFTK
ncbi:DNA repair protein XRCC4 [Drosophila bipectinata]|uniref:DNA repair protein XRCC4 n=1 Tax=Drosophila bipectinata TaxID=42026 RepID=UPI001C8A58D9|nr:uncharacterized protein LOC108119586 [Drosophila bipectinata]XP_043069948.1 uncharacterized protein LOC108119586 [Drosophila bipectinata]